MESLLKNLEKYVTCSICLEHYTRPKTIHCLHTFCCECLEKHARASHKKGKFRCPECQAQVDLPEGNRFDRLPTSFLHNSLLSVLAVRQSSDGAELTCSNCTKASSELHYCFECEQFFCPICLSAHQLIKKAFEGHKVISVKDFQAEDYQALLKRQPFCPHKYHEREVMRFYCLPCQTCLCQVCIITDHKTHEVVPLDKAADDEKANIMAGVELIEAKVESCNDVIRQFETTAFEIQTNRTTTKQEVSQTVERMIATLREREREVFAAIEETCETRLEKLNSALKQVQSLMKQMKQAAEFAKNLAQSCSSPDIMQKTGNLGQRFGELRDMKVPTATVTSFMKFIPAQCAPDSFSLGFIDSETDVNRSTMEGLSQTLQAGLKAEFYTLCPKTSEGGISKCHKDQVEVVVEPAQQIASLMVCEREDGNFQVKFTPKVPGGYRIVVKINGEKLPNSPFTVQVKERQLVVVSELDLKGETLQDPRGIAVNSKGKVAVADGEGHCVVIFDKDGSYLTKLGCHGKNPGQFDSVADVTFLNDKEILVAEDLNHRIQQFNVETGTFVKAFGKYGSAEGMFKSLVSVCMDDKGHVVVAEFNNSRIQVLTKDGEPVLKFGDSGSEKLHRPVYCIHHKGRFVVSDSGDHCVKVFEESGKFLYKFGEEGHADGQFQWPCGLCISDNCDTLLVCDSNKRCIQQFTLEGRFTGKSVTKMQNPWGIATVSDGRILVADKTAKRVCICK